MWLKVLEDPYDHFRDLRQGRDEGGFQVRCRVPLEALETPLDHLRDGRQSRYKDGNQDQNAVPDYRWSKFSTSRAILQRSVEGEATTNLSQWHSVLSQWCKDMIVNFGNSRQPRCEDRKDLKPLAPPHFFQFPSERDRETHQQHI